MKRRVDDKPDYASEREKLIGLGKRSISKSYYPELRNQLDELERFRALLDRVSDAIIIVDAETGIIRDVSGSTGAIIGCGKEGLIGMEFKELLPEHIARYSSHLFNSKTGMTNLETDLCCPRSIGKPAVPVEMSLQTIDHRGSRQVVIVARDISERKRSEEALKKSHDQLEIRVRERTRELDRANRAKGEFLSIVSHELRTPLTSVIGFAKIIRKKLMESIYPAVCTDDAKTRKEMERVWKNIDIIVSEGDRLTALINDVLDLAKLEANRIEYKMEPINPNEFLSRAMDSVSALFEGSNLILLADIDPGLPTVRGNQDRLIQVMVNLFSNAVKFTKEGVVTCRARRVGDHVRVSVADTGIGIPEDLLATIFDKFTQGQESLADRPQGTGLGLPICRHIIIGHGGHIWAESTQNKGSKFIFTLPVFS